VKTGILLGQLWVFYYNTVFKNDRRLVKQTIKSGFRLVHLYTVKQNKQTTFNTNILSQTFKNKPYVNPLPQPNVKQFSY
jgi:hypothetical protein